MADAMQKALCTRDVTDLATLRRLAEDFARERGQKPTTTHLLAAIASGHDEAAELLLERRLDVDVVLKAARVTLDDDADALARTLQKARELAGRSGAGRTEARAVHVLFALCQQGGTAAHRAMVQCGLDVTRLRIVTMQLAMGIAPPRRTVLSRTVTSTTSERRASGIMPTAPVSKPASRPPVAPVPLHSASASKPHPTRVKKRAGGPQAPSQKKSFVLDPKQFPMLSALGQNLTDAAARGELDPVVGRDAEIERALDVLAKRHANNACLVGAPGVGKTSIVHGLASRIAKGVDVACFEDRIVIGIEPTSLLAGTAVRGSLAEKIGQLKTEVVRAKGRVILFIDEMHVLLGQDAGDEAASELRLALGRGEIVCIGATTAEDYRRVVDADPGLSRCFTPIEIGELSPEQALSAIQSITPLFEKHHACTYEHETLAKAIAWSVRYLPGKALPDKAVQILDLAGARAKRRGESKIEPRHVAEVVSELAGVPEERLLETDAERLLHIEQLLAARIVGHAHALERIATVLRRNASGFRSKRPIGTFLLLGPTGVGKTETAKAIAECLFHSDSAMTRLDLSEYAEPHAIARLVGAPPGYVGHDAGGQLTEAVRRRPYQVVLLDEIEKAHRDVLESFLGVFDEGRLTDGRGRTVDFTNTVILLTSNIGADLTPKASARGRIGFGSTARTARDEYRAREIDVYRAAVTEAARHALPPELYNRIDEVLAFAPLGRDDVAEIARRILRSLAADLETSHGVKLEADPAAIDALLDAGGFDAEMGARPMRRAIGRHIEAPIAEMILKGILHRGDVARVHVDRGALVVDAVTPHP
ncbi:MAG: ATP-dependent Clp protease ATP-binding subunit [Polyangiaceae bacterium]|nr:ATP-dependent Clp protease ATP-binding subunit [Polyangiaceae bacterium]